MTNSKIDPFFIIGIAIRTTNENGQAAKDIPALWQKFFAKNILPKIPHKIHDDIYCIYTDYEKDFTKPYTTLLGCKVESLENIPEGLVGKKFEGGDYTKFTTQGNLDQGIVFEAWNKIWQTDIKRAYTADFEVYGSQAQDAKNAVVEILIAINM